MRKILMVLGIAAGLVLAAAPAQAETTVVRNIPLENTIYACGETITLSGSLIGVFTEQPLPDGGFLITSHYSEQGVTGTSSSGATYHATGLTRRTDIYAPSGGGNDFFIYRLNLVGTGGAPTYYVRVTLHVTVTPTGEITALVDNFSLDCV